MTGVDESMAVMQDEIFGPILPVMAYRELDDVLAFINRRERPLALYLFSNDSSAEERVLGETSSGGACINGTIMHISNAKMPFGGVGPSGMGAYHGRHSFETFSHRKAVLRRGFRLDMKLMYPPYSKTKTNMVKRML